MPRGKKFTAEQIIGKLREAVKRNFTWLRGRPSPRRPASSALQSRPTTGGNGSMVAFGPIRPND